MGAYIGIDWGTTNRRAFLVDADGAVLDRVRDDRGVLSLSRDAYPAEIAALRDRLGALPVLAAGMVGSTRGWHDVAYVDAPADLRALAAGAWHDAASDATIVPGVALRGARADVMRGEEVQVLGAIAAGLAPADALFCQPGTHNKWIVARAGAIVDFATLMTGELFALLRGHGILAGMLDAPVATGAAFDAGLVRGRMDPALAGALFGVRAGVPLGDVAPDDAASFASGVLIGADVASRDDLAGADVHLLGTGALVDLYAAALVAAGARPIAIDGDAAFVAGIHRLWETTR